MKNTHLTTMLINRQSKGCCKGKQKNNRAIYKTQRQKYLEGIKDFKDSLKDYRDFKGISKDSLMKYKEKYKKIYNKYPSKNMSIYDIKKACKAIKA